MLPMLWKLRLLWYRTDKASVAFALFFALIVGALVFALTAVHAERDERSARVREFHARSLECLARNVYYEARGESSAGQYAVAEVTMNRKASQHYPKTVCEVVYQREAFSWTGMGPLDEPAGDALAFLRPVGLDIGGVEVRDAGMKRAWPALVVDLFGDPHGSLPGVPGRLVERTHAGPGERFALVHHLAHGLRIML